jgi:hypothetical protein
VIITTGRIRRTLVNKINLLVDSPRSIESSRLAPVKAESIILRRASGCFDTSCGLSRDSSSTTSPRAGSSSTTSPTPRVRVPRHVARLVTRLVVDYFDYAARPGASARRAAHHATCRVARRRLLHLRRASRCLNMSSGSSRRSSSTTWPPSRVRVPQHVARLVTQLVVDYFDYVVHLGASTHRAARHAARRAARRRLLRLCRASGVLGTSRLVTRLVVDYFTYVAHSVASAHLAARRVTHRRLLHLAQARRRLLRLRRASGCLGTSRGSSRGSLSTTSPTPCVRLLRHVARLVT